MYISVTIHICICMYYHQFDQYITLWGIMYFSKEGVLQHMNNMYNVFDIYLLHVWCGCSYEGAFKRVRTYRRSVLRSHYKNKPYFEIFLINEPHRNERFTAMEGSKSEIQMRWLFLQEGDKTNRNCKKLKCEKKRTIKIFREEEFCRML